MPSDIRSFFGGGGGAGGGGASASKPATSTSKTNTPTTAKGRGRSKKVVISDDDDEEPTPVKKMASTPKKKQSAAVKDEETTSSAYFASKPKPKSTSTPIRSRAGPSTNGTPSNKSNGATPSSARRSGRKTGKSNYAEGDDSDVVMLDDDVGGDDDIDAEAFKSHKAEDDYQDATDSDDQPVKSKSKARGKVVETTDDDDELETAEIGNVKGNAAKKSQHTTTNGKSNGRKRKSAEVDEDEDDEDDEPKKKAKKPAAKGTPKKPAAKKEDREESKDMQAIYDSIPLIRPPTPPPRGEDSKFTFKPGGGNLKAEPVAAGSKTIPTGADGCLSGLNFVFTGVQESLGREEGQNLVKRYGGKVTGAPSKKTSYVVVGADAGPKKLETIRSLGIKSIDEDGLFALIRNLPPGGGDSKAAEAFAEKREKEEQKIRKAAEEEEKLAKEKTREAAKAARAIAARSNAAPPKYDRTGVDDRLLVDKYAPDSLSSVCGNKAVVEKLQNWLRGWKRSAKYDFKQAGKDGVGIYRAAMLHGPPGIGKTTAAHLVAKLEGYDVVETNASDTRSKKLMEQSLRGVTDTTSLLGFFTGDGKKVDEKHKNLVLIMDEVDGMSAGDRGGVGALAAVAKKTKIPMILICNERRLPKMKPFDHVTGDFAFRRPTTEMIKVRMATICFREKIKLPPEVMQAIIEGGNADIRRIINMVSTIKMDGNIENLDFDDSKAMSKAWEKHVILKPWDIVSKIMRPQMFSASSTATLNEKTELYFNDHEVSYLMLQENYLKSQPSRLAGLNGKENNLKYLELVDKAAESISDGDLVDRMIHGSQQQWSLMPLHAIFSFVKPASYVYGNFNAQVGFAGWLGQNSKAGKLSRYVKEIQGHMRLRTSADRNEIRQQYMPALWNATVGQLVLGGKEAVPKMIDFMDSYYLTKDDYDAIIELGVGVMDMENERGVKKLDTQTKATFTRLYNAQSHPMPFVKASAMAGVKGGAGAAVRREKPDLEEAIEDDVDGPVEAEVDQDAVDEEDMDLSKDKYIKKPKAKKAAAGGAAKGKGKGKRKKDDDEDEDEEEEDEKPKKKAGKKGKGKA